MQDLLPATAWESVKGKPAVVTLPAEMQYEHELLSLLELRLA